MTCDPHSKAGATLIGLIGVIVVMALLAAGLVMLFNIGLLDSLEYSGSTTAYLAAETGLSVGRAYIMTNPAWSASLPLTLTGLVGRAAYGVEISSTHSPLARIVSTGRSGEDQYTSIWEGTASVIRAIAAYVQSAPNPAAPRCIEYTTSGVFCDEQEALSIGAVAQWQRLAACPRRNEFLLVSQNSSQWIWAQTHTNGVWGSLTQLNTAGAAIAGARGFDVAYEDVSGRGVVVYSVGAATPRYRTWNGTNWSTESSINVAAGGAIRWVRLVSRPGTNEVMCLVRWSVGPADYSSAIVWKGNTWTNLQTLENNCSSEISYDTMDATYSSNSALVVYINGANATQRSRPKYRTYQSSTWSGEGVMTALGAAPCWMRVEFSPDGSLAFAGFLYLSGSSRLGGSYWDGSTWSPYETFKNAKLETSARRDFDVAWGTRSNVLMVTYCELNTHAHSYMLDTPLAAPVYGSMAAVDDGRWCVLKRIPGTDGFLYMSVDDQSDVHFQRWNGTSWALMAEKEELANLDYNFLDMAFRKEP